MLECFFGKPQTFSVLNWLLSREEQEINYLDIVNDLDISKQEVFSIITPLMVLDIIQSKGDGLSFNRESPIVLLIKIFDDFITQFIEDKVAYEGEDDVEFYLKCITRHAEQKYS